MVGEMNQRVPSTGLREGLLDEIVAAVCRATKPRRIILFGSRARGEWDQRSDIDLAIIPEEGAVFHPSTIEEEIRTLLRLDILDFRKLTGSFQREILENGIVIYEAT